MSDTKNVKKTTSTKPASTAISTAKPQPPPEAAPAVTERHIPKVPKVNAGNIEYDATKVDEVLANFAELAEKAATIQKKTKTPNPNRNIARNIVARLFPHISVLITKGYSKKAMYEMFTAQGIAINFAGFSSAINKQIKAAKEQEEAEAAKLIALEQVADGNVETPILDGKNVEPPTDVELAEEKNLATHDAQP